MDYVALLSFRPAASAADRDAALTRRAAWQYPENLRLIAEYWPMASAVQVVSIFAADSFDSVLEFVLEWNDIFDVDVHPAVSAADGLEMGPDVVGRLPRLQPRDSVPGAELDPPSAAEQDS
ncbi:MAG: DUF3303 domain-containing protein [Streptosporangiaceae bacterium]